MKNELSEIEKEFDAIVDKFKLEMQQPFVKENHLSSMINNSKISEKYRQQLKQSANEIAKHNPSISQEVDNLFQQYFVKIVPFPS